MFSSLNLKVETTTISLLGSKPKNPVKRNFVIVSTFKPMRPDFQQFVLEHTNAIKSWKQLGERVKIIIVGDDDGTKEMCEQYNLQHELPQQKLFGRPTVSSIICKGYEYATDDDYVAYINGDIILPPNTLEILDNIEKLNPTLFADNFLLTCSRVNWFDFKPIDFTNPSWEEDIHNNSHLEVDLPIAIDIFIHKRYALKDMPPFVLGKYCFDNWIMQYTITNFPNTIDCTGVLNILHQFGKYHLGDTIYEREGFYTKVTTDPNDEGCRHNFKFWEAILRGAKRFLGHANHTKYKLYKIGKAMYICKNLFS